LSPERTKKCHEWGVLLSEHCTWNPSTTKSMVDYSAIQKFLNKKNHFFTFYTKADKPVKIVIRHMPGNTSAKDITVALQETDYDVIGVTDDCRTSHYRMRGHTNLPSPSS
jgi:hypothetical protein